MEMLGVAAHDTDDDLGRVVPVNESAFAELYAATWPRMYRTAYAIARDAGAAEDAVQSAYAKAFAEGAAMTTDQAVAYALEESA